jgi:hypothetical protein
MFGRNPVKSTNDQFIRNVGRMMQPIVFEGASSVGGFTDIDACYDVKGKAVVFIEVKRAGNDITTGQKILFERLVRWISKPCYCMTVWHSAEDDENIMLADCEVKEIRMKDSSGKAIIKTSKKHTVADIISYIEKKHGA